MDIILEHTLFHALAGDILDSTGAYLLGVPGCSGTHF